MPLTAYPFIFSICGMLKRIKKYLDSGYIVRVGLRNLEKIVINN